MARISSLGDFVRVRTGKLDANAAHENGKYPFFTCSKEPLAINTYSFDCECVLLAGNGEFHVSYYSGPFDAYQRTYVIESLDVERLSVPYLYYFMRYYSAELRKLSVGGVIKFIKLGNIKDAPIPMPTISEQRRIVDLLSRAEGIVRLRREAEKKAAELIPALFLDMFGDPGRNPKGWPVATLGRHVKIPSTVRTPNLSTESDFLCMGADSIESLSGKLISMPTVRDVLPKSGKYWFEDGDVLYSKIRPYLAKATLAHTGGYCSADMYPLRCHPTLRPIFLLSLLLSSAFTEYATAESVRVSMPKLNRETLFKYPFPMPPVDLQVVFSERAEAMQSIQLQQSTATTKAQATFEALLAQAFSNNGANV